MAIPRRRLLPPRPVWTHVVSRCVRRAYLCGGRDGKWDHRRLWVEERLRALAGVFAVEVAAYAVMSNHVHVVLRMAPEATTQWSASEVAERWLAVFGKNVDRQVIAGQRAAAVARLAQQAEWIAERRQRLTDLSWFMRAFKESLARRANAEDECSGRFWEGRFTSVPLLDQAALVACMAYVDLNPVRARLAPTPEASQFTSARQRVRARQRHRTVTRVRAAVAAGTVDAAQAAQHLRAAGVAREQEAEAAASPEAGMFLAPLTRCRHVANGQPVTERVFTVDEYLTLVDLTGRAIRPGKSGAIDPRLPALLSRLDLRVDAWVATMTGWRQMHGSGLGAAAARTAAASERGLRWIRNRCALFAGDRAA